MKKKKFTNKGMTLPELIVATLMLSSFTAVFLVVAEFTGRFFQPMNNEAKDEFINSDKELTDVLNDTLQINIAFDAIEEILTQPATEKDFILKLKCTSLPYLDWGIPAIDDMAIPKNYSICIKPTQLVESSYLSLNQAEGNPGIYILYSKPNNGISYNSIPVRRIICRPRPFCNL